MTDIISTVNPTSAISAIGTHGSSVPSTAMEVGLEARTSEGTALTSGQTVRQIGTTLGRSVDTEQNVPGLTWQYAAASGGETGTSDVTIASAVVGSRHYIKSVDVVNKSATGTEVVLKDGSTVIWRTSLGQNEGITRVFSPPLRCSSSAIPKFANITTGAQVYLNATGYYSKE